MGHVWWPPGIAREVTLAAFLLAYESVGYRTCSDGTRVLGVEKIAIFALNDVPRHVARQLEDGQWTSKLGPAEDITHATLDALEGPLYGRAVAFMGRPR